MESWLLHLRKLLIVNQSWTVGKFVPTTIAALLSLSLHRSFLKVKTHNFIIWNIPLIYFTNHLDPIWLSFNGLPLRLTLKLPIRLGWMYGCVPWYPARLLLIGLSGSLPWLEIRWRSLVRCGFISSCCHEKIYEPGPLGCQWWRVISNANTHLTLIYEYNDAKKSLHTLKPTQNSINTIKLSMKKKYTHYIICCLCMQPSRARSLISTCPFLSCGCSIKTLYLCFHMLLLLSQTTMSPLTALHVWGYQNMKAEWYL